MTETRPNASETNLDRRRIFLDIGAAHGPAMDEGRTFTGNDIYIGVDAGYEADAPRHRIKGGYDEAHKSLETFSAAAQRLPRLKDQNIYFVGAKGQELPLRPNSVHEVILGNVLGAPISPHTAWGILNEAHRVLEDNGQLVINESVTPMPNSWLKPFLLSAGFKITELVTMQEDYDRVKEMERKRGLAYDIPLNPNDSGYFCVAEKANRTEQKEILKEVEAGPTAFFSFSGEAAPWNDFLEQLPGFIRFDTVEAFEDWWDRRHETPQSKKYVEDIIFDLGGQAVRWAGQKVQQKARQVYKNHEAKKRV